MSALHELRKCGQSYWIDNLTRGKITSGELHRRVTDSPSLPMRRWRRRISRL